MKRPRPICPECGSADVVVGDKTGSCNRCGETFRAEAARQPGVVDGPTQRSSAGPKRLTDEPADDWQKSLAERRHEFLND